MPRYFALTASVACALNGVEGARHRRTGSTVSMAGVPVHNYRADAQEWMVAFSDGATDASLDSFCHGKCALVGHPDKGGTAFVKLYGSESDVERMVKENPESIEFVEPDTMDFLIPEIEETEVDEVGVAGLPWNLQRVGVATRPTSAGAGVHVHIQDSGVRGTHRDFGGRVIPTLDISTGELFECNGNADCAPDMRGHGTHCAGGAAGNTYGVASAATIHAVKSMNDEGQGARAWQVAAIDWITASGVLPSVISMSLGGRGADPVYTKSIGAATAKGIVVVVAAGNSGLDSCDFSPAFAADAITVAGTTTKNSRAYYSNFGECNDIYAPGSSITSTSSKSDTSTKKLSGTSMAAPHVAGGAALLLAEDGGMQRSGVMATMQVNGLKGFVTSMREGDPDLFLWVGTDAAPSPAPGGGGSGGCRRRAWCR